MTTKLKVFAPAVDGNYEMCKHLGKVVDWYDECKEAGDTDRFGGAKALDDRSPEKE